jgi:hypothetical protein
LCSLVVVVGVAAAGAASDPSGALGTGGVPASSDGADDVEDDGGADDSSGVCPTGTASGCGRAFSWRAGGDCGISSSVGAAFAEHRIMSASPAAIKTVQNVRRSRANSHLKPMLRMELEIAYQGSLAQKPNDANESMGPTLMVLRNLAWSRTVRHATIKIIRAAWIPAI